MSSLRGVGRLNSSTDQGATAHCTLAATGGRVVSEVRPLIVMTP